MTALTLEARPMPNTPPPQRRRALQSPSEARAARQYAEVLYQALRRWDVQESDVTRFDYGRSAAGKFQVLGVGNWASGGSTATPGTEQLLTLPWGSTPERNFGLVMLDLLNSRDSDQILYGKLLARIQTSVSPASLVRDEGGWAFPRERSIRYALAVLAFAERRGQPEASYYAVILEGELSKPQD